MIVLLSTFFNFSDESNLEDKFVVEGDIAQALEFQDVRNKALKEIKRAREVEEARQAKEKADMDMEKDKKRKLDQVVDPNEPEGHPLKRLTLEADGASSSAEAIDIDTPDNNSESASYVIELD